MAASFILLLFPKKSDIKQKLWGSLLASPQHHVD